MDVLQRQVDEYENEIRVLKDFKSPTKGASSKRTPRRALTSVSDMSPYGRGGGTGADESNAGVLEATIFRPALQRALKDASKWKASSIGAALASLPPLPTPLNSSGGTNSSVDALQDLTTALASWRREKASASLVDLSRRDKSAKAQFREMLGREASASRRVKEVVLQYQRTS